MHCNKKTIRQILLVIIDILIIVLASYLALVLRFDINYIPLKYKSFLVDNIFEIIFISLVINFLYKMYNSMWEYTSIIELFNIVLASITSIFVEYLYERVLYIRYPLSYYLIKLMILILCYSLFRISYRVFRYIKSGCFDKQDNSYNTMIIGAGEAGNLLIKDIYNNKKYKNNVVCLIDDNQNKIGTFIHGIKVVGDRYSIVANVLKYDIDLIIIAIPSAAPTDIQEIVSICNKTNCKIKKLPDIYSIIGNVGIEQVKELSYADLLGRPQVSVKMEKIDNLIKNKVVLVTGGGGSIGSELCRQIAYRHPKKLIIFDIYENNAYDIQNELLRNFKDIDLEVIIGSVRDYDRVLELFNKYKPDYVFHAAAHKHVPLMEDSPCESIKNNCLGTLNVVKASDKYKVKKFVLISTDKAVRPTSIMGASKRICEMIIQTYNKISKTEFVAVRFGNVLGSNGSVIPLFLKQIDLGGPVTVTDSNIIRYFMTIPEAVILIMEATSFAKGGEIFILDMGKPVKIYDLACKLIELKGYIPNKDIKIEITGLRKGEKLYEELLMDEEGIKSTSNNLIHIASPIKFDDKKFLKDLNQLIASAFKNDKNIKKKVVNITKTYTITDNEECRYE